MTATPASDRVVGGHRLGRRIGRGGMGEVWEAVHLASGASRALKLMPAGADPDQRARFEREGEAQARAASHPHVVRVHAAGVEPDGGAWISMDLLAGGDLRRRIQAGPLGPRAAAEVVAALARGLEHAHAQGVLHRDVKPENVLVDEQGRPLLADFGLARVADATGLTASGTILGTPAYAAPEQLNGEGASPASDVYGLGAVLYEALTGQPPFRAGNLVLTLRAVLSQAPIPPRRLLPEVPPALEALALRALEKDPSRRPAGAGALAAELEAWLRGGAAPRGRGYALGGIGLLLVAVLAIGAQGLRAGALPASVPSAVSSVALLASHGPVARHRPDAPRAEAAPVASGLAKIEEAHRRLSEQELRDVYSIARVLRSGDSLGPIDRELREQAETGDPAACLQVAGLLGLAQSWSLAGRFLWLATRHSSRPPLPRALLADHIERTSGGGEACAVALELAREAAFLPGAGAEEAAIYARLLTIGKHALSTRDRTQQLSRRAREELPLLGPVLEPAWGRWLGLAQLRTLGDGAEREEAVRRILRHGPNEPDRQLSPHMAVWLGPALCDLGRPEDGVAMLLRALRGDGLHDEAELRLVRGQASAALERLLRDGRVPAGRVAEVQRALRDADPGRGR